MRGHKKKCRLFIMLKYSNDMPMALFHAQRSGLYLASMSNLLAGSNEQRLNASGDRHTRRRAARHNPIGYVYRRFPMKGEIPVSSPLVA